MLFIVNFVFSHVLCREQSSLDRADWKKTILGEIESLRDEEGLLK